MRIWSHRVGGGMVLQLLSNSSVSTYLLLGIFFTNITVYGNHGRLTLGAGFMEFTYDVIVGDNL